MRDLLFLLVFIVLLYFAIKRPFLGVSLWLWISLFYPKGWLYGFGQGIRYNLIIAAVTILTYLILKDKPRTPWTKLNVLVLLFFIWTFITSIFNIGQDDIVWADWIEFLKIFLLFFFATLIVRTDNQINMIIWMVALSIGFYASVEGLKYIASGGGHVLAGMAGHTLGDRNDLATAINTSIPLIAYLLFISKHKVIRFSLIIMLILCVVSVLGSNSRGGFIGITVLGAYFWLQSKHKLIYLLIVPTAFFIGLEYMPESWHQRMATLENAQEDMSFLGRIMAWKQATLIAMDNITGGGFKAGQLNYNWFYYDPQNNLNWIIDTSAIYFDTAKAAHSIYFQVLGDHGFPGLIIFLMMLITAFRTARSLSKHYKTQSSTDPLAKLSAMLQLSIFTYMVAGAAVSLAYFDLLYMLFALVYVIDIRVKTQERYPLVKES